MTQNRFQLERFLPYRLSLLANTVSKTLALAYQDYGLNRTQWRVLAVLASGKANAQNISDKTLMDKTTISRVVKTLLERGLVRRCAGHRDGRISPLSLTKQGQDTFAAILPHAYQIETQIFTKLDTNQRKNLETIIAILLDE